jgi:predicted house-cleaning noncanonical NTP pyrophosphatase (MazG superfamily)
MGKLIRDRIPEILERRGVEFTTTVLDDAGFSRALRMKVLEEAQEVADAENAADLVEELGDLYEVLLALAEHEGVSEQEIRTRAAAKRETHGGFAGRLFTTSYR